MNRILITHVWNEELYIRGWLRHHAPLFDHGVIILTPSTDATEAIIKQEVPDWTIVPAYTAKLTSGILEKQVQDIEAEYHQKWPSCWKMCLTVTEYLMVDNLSEALWDVQGKAFYITGYGLVDSPSEVKAPYDPAIPLVKQRHYGFDMMKVQNKDRNCGRRLLHRHPRGIYHIGRHWCYLKDVQDYPGIKLVRAFYSPYNEEGISRKLGMGIGISDDDKREGRCWQHFMTREQIQADYERLLKESTPLTI
jgi:hypothetical protein